MDLSHMREVLTLAEHLNFTTAAAKLYVSQPTLTRHVNAVEEELGVNARYPGRKAFFNLR